MSDVGLERLRTVVAAILEPGRAPHDLRLEVARLTTLLRDAATIDQDCRENLASCECRTPNGLALSPGMAAKCAEDYVRTVQFIRGAHAAILDVQQRLSGCPVRVLYVGCGPYATLAVPLMAVFSPTAAQFGLLDIHRASIDSARSVVHSLGLSRSVEDYQVVDASAYCVCPDQAPDVVLLETMQACLEREPQVALTRHLLQQAPGAVLIPQEVRVELMLVDPAPESDRNALQPKRAYVRRDRIAIGPLFVLNSDTVNSWRGHGDERLPAASVRIPDAVDDRYEPMLFTTVHVYGSQVLRDYDSRITRPRRLNVQRSVRAGDSIHFYYELGTHPRLSADFG
jgi:hypothetical protein